MDKRLTILFFVQAFILIIQTSAYAQWQQTSGPTSGRVRSFVVFDSNLFAATAGVYSFNFDEENWKNMSNGLPVDADITSFAVLGSNIFAGGNGIFLSPDIGQNWIPVKNGIDEYARIFDIAVMDTVLFAAAQIETEYSHFGTVYRTIDYGKNWEGVKSSSCSRSSRFLCFYWNTKW
jgi:photosystem II stability/assembly factor-like uncharacterized protein